MKRAGLMLAVILTTLSALAVGQAERTLIATQVPFAFVAANQVFPAGYCVVRSAGQLLQINSATTARFTSASLEQNAGATDAYTLVFHKQGDKYFLREIKLGASGIAYELPESKAEAEMRAANVPSTEETVLASLN